MQQVLESNIRDRRLRPPFFFCTSCDSRNAACPRLCFFTVKYALLPRPRLNDRHQPICSCIVGSVVGRQIFLLVGQHSTASLSMRFHRASAPVGSIGDGWDVHRTPASLYCLAGLDEAIGYFLRDVCRALE